MCWGRRLTLPADAAAGNHPIVVVSQAPYNAVLANLKISPNVPLSGENNFRITNSRLTRGLYQTAYSAKRNAVFVTSAVGRPPVRQSELLRLYGDTLAVQARITPAAAPGRTNSAGETSDGGAFAVYGVGVDDAHDTVWVTQSRQNTVAVYRQGDLSLVRQFEPGTVNHARDVVIADTPVGAGALNVAFEPIARRAYVSNFGAGTITVVDVDGRIFANLPAPPAANHVAANGRGNVYAAVKSGWAGDGDDSIQLIGPRR